MSAVTVSTNLNSQPWRRVVALTFALALGIVLSVITSQTQAQLRTFPEKTKVGMLQMGNFPEALLDDERIRFAPGVRILNEANISVIPMSIQGPKRIRYRLDPTGQIDLAWILSEAEALEATRKRE